MLLKRKGKYLLVIIKIWLVIITNPLKLILKLQVLQT